MFYDCEKLTSLNLSSFNTGKVTNMSYMFYGCKNLTSLDLSSFNTEKVTDMSAMFDDCWNLTSLDLSSFNTSNVEDMNSMFYYCEKLTSLDLSKFNTANVTNMSYMFYACSSLTSLDLSSFNTSNVTDMNWMFSGCTKLTSLDLSSFNTSNVTNMRRMFQSCDALTSLDLSKFNTENVTDMYNMFYGCNALTSIDLRSFNTANVTDMSGMFKNCGALKTIICNSDWSTSAALNYSQEMFSGCTSLVGGNGTAYDENHTDVAYARPDEEGNPGYFTEKKDLYTAFDAATGTLTYYYDTKRFVRAAAGEITEMYDPVNDPDAKRFKDYKDQVTKAVIDASMKDAGLTSMYRMFEGLRKMVSIEGMSNLVTDKVESMNGMFYQCSALKDVDLSRFNTKNVTDMYAMFFTCQSLTSLNLSSFDTRKVKSMYAMFKDCHALKEINLRNFDMVKATTVQDMFYGCFDLKTIYCNNDWSASETLTESHNLFKECHSLVGVSGTACDGENNIDKTYARIDFGSSEPGYFSPITETYTVFDEATGTLEYHYDHLRGTHDGIEELYPAEDVEGYVRFEGYAEKVKKAIMYPSMQDAHRRTLANMFYGSSPRGILKNLKEIEGLDLLNYTDVTDLSGMFLGCSSLEELDVTPLALTANVKDLSQMFYGCSSLTELNLTSFNISSVIDMSSMFAGCESLSAIYCNQDWSISPANSSEMFYDCVSLVGEFGTECNGQDNIDNSYALPDTEEGAKGYFTSKVREAYTAFDESTGILTYYYDDLRHDREQTSIAELYKPLNGGTVRFEGYANKVKKAVIDKSFKKASLRSLANMFYGGKGENSLTALEWVEGLENINYSRVKDMSGMFRNCSALRDLDVTPINTRNVENLNTMFFGCRQLTVLDVTGFILDNVKLMSMVFADCRSLTTIYCKNNWSASSAASTEMFDGCTSLTGGMGSPFDGTHTDKTYARMDRGEGQPGYFTRPEYPNGRFTINDEGDQIQFSQGNLQFNAARGSHACADGTTQPGSWRFATNQWNYIGEDNKNISESYYGLIDLFGWATSGWDSGAKAYQPWSASKESADYLYSEEGLVGDHAYADWGVYNQIENDAPGTWRTMSISEWTHLLNLRQFAGNLRGHGTVNGVHGYILLPDDFQTPAGLTFTWHGKDQEVGTNDWNDNVFDDFSWYRMERAGAIFLPAAGYRNGNLLDLSFFDAYGYYWINSQFSQSQGRYFFFERTTASPSAGYFNHYGRSVRLVRVPEDAPSFTITVSSEGHGTAKGSGTYQKGQVVKLTATPDEDYKFSRWSDGSTANPRYVTVREDLTVSAIFVPVSGGGGDDDDHTSFTVGDKKKVQFSPGNLRYQASTGTWSFAEHEWDYYGVNNANISDTYEGWIDLFGWGTGNAPTKTSTTSADYSLFTDWGTNPIGTDAPGTWRTLTSDEWDYLFNSREDASNKYGAAKVNDIAGIVILPDSWKLPEGCQFTAGMVSDFYYVTNKYTPEQWDKMRESGAVFLPAAGYRYYNGVSNTVSSPGSVGYYWSSTAYSAQRAFSDYFSSSSNNATKDRTLYFGQSVRLVADVREPAEPKVYTEYDANSYTLTYYYDDQYNYRAGVIVFYDPVNDPDAVRFKDYSALITKAVIDASMTEAKLTSTKNMFYGGEETVDGVSNNYRLHNLTQITGMENLNTFNVTDMSGMFYSCSGLAKLDLSPLNTEKVENMSAMFYGCSGLTELDLSPLNTDKVTDMHEMFAWSTSLEKLDLSPLNTENVTDMSGMFKYCTGLKELDLSNLYTVNVTNMKDMFSGCSKLTELDVRSFKTDKVTDMQQMFFNCSALTTIYCNSDWSLSQALSTHTAMFYNCSVLKGGNGTAYNEYFTNKMYARPDITGQAGYFTFKDDTEVYTAFDESTGILTYYYDNQRFSRDGRTEVYNPEKMRFKGYRQKVTKAIIHSSMQDARLTSTKNMFCAGTQMVGSHEEVYGLTNLSSVEGLDNLVTDYVEDMSGMFNSCSRLESLDLSSFNTANVTNMSNMFYECSSLTELNLNSFNTGKVTNMSNMFFMCMWLTTIYCSNPWNESTVLTSSTNMFEGCRSLVGGNGTKYDSSHTSVAYAHPDGGASNPGYFTANNEVYTVFDATTGTLTYYYDAQRLSHTGVTEVYDPVNNPDAVRFEDYHDQVKKAVIDKSMKDAGLTSMSSMFYGAGSGDIHTNLTLSEMTEIEGMENLVTDDVTNMSAMFYHCYSLTSLDLSKFNTENVTNMRYMFCNCSLLNSLDLSSFNTSNVTDMLAMFGECGNLTSLDLSSFNTSNVEDMAEMFLDCKSLTSLDLSSFNTENVTNMRYMFSGLKLTSLDLSSFNTGKVTKMSYMFYDCKSLTSLDLTSFNTSNVEDMNSMFYYCEKLTSLDLSKFNTSKVTNMSRMFHFCKNLTSLDLSSFNTEKVTDMSYMFIGCDNLQTIICNDNWSVSTALTDSYNMFYNCTSLVGGNGTKYDENNIDAAYAHPDEEGNPGYFTAKDEVYAVLESDNETLTLYYDNQRASRGGGDWTLWNCDKVKTVILHESMQDARPKSTKYWFCEFFALTEIQHLEYLNTSEVTDMSHMFYCPSLTELDLSKFNTDKVTDMSRMFQSCEKLTSLDLSSFNTSNVTNMNGMFFGCKSLTSLDLSKFNTSKVTNMSRMFQSCEKLTSLDLSSLNTDNVTDMSDMFSSCSALKTIFCNDYWSASTVLASSTNIFEGCRSLVGGNGTEYDEDYTDAAYAHPDEEGNPGYFTLKHAEVYTVSDGPYGTLTYYYDDERAAHAAAGERTKIYDPMQDPDEDFRYSKAVIDVSMRNAHLTSTRNMFRNFLNITEIEGLENLVTDEVTDMSRMFYDCEKLTSLDLRSFNTEKVTDMSFMFLDCESLQTILCNDDWNASTVLTSSMNMFEGCRSLVGGMGTTYDENHVDAAYAHPDGGKGNQGYFTEKKTEVYTSFNETTGILTYYYDDQRAAHRAAGEITEPYDPVNNPDAVRFEDYHDQVLKAVIDESMKEAGLTSMRNLFYGGYEEKNGNYIYYSLSKMTKIEGMENLVVDKVEVMWSMFEGCSSLTSIDLSHFNAAIVNNISGMFADCHSLVSLDLTSFSTKYLIAIQTFRDCKALTTILCNEDWSKISLSEDMFKGCTSLVGGMGTTYDENHTDAAYARRDKEGNPGYFTEKDLQPLPNDETTTFDFSLIDPFGSEFLGITLGAKDQYNATEGRIEITSTNTVEEIDEKLNAAFAGAASFKSLLPGTITFKLEKGQGEIEIDCMTLPGYVLKVRIAKYGTAFISSTIEQAIRGKATVNYNVTQDTYVAIYLEGTSPATAPARIARSKKEEDSGAYVYSIVVTPKNTPTGVEPTFSDPSGNVKVMINGILYILRDGKIFTPTGVQVK